MTIRAYSYVRFSRPEQMRGDTLRRQTERADAWAKAKGIVIDETLTDLGVSAFRGKNRLVGALGKFLSLVEAGRVERGSYLILESLDRLSRENVMEVLPRFLDLINSGITVVTLTDGQEYSADRLKTDSMPLIMSLVVMTRAHEESSTKAGRVAEAWAKKRARAATEVVTSRVPAWLTVVGEGAERRIECVPDRAEVVRRIILESGVGIGRRRIARGLTEDPTTPVFGKGGRGWQPSYVKKIIENRAVVGEYQPTVLKDGKWVPAGLPIHGYFPAVVTEAEFARANAAKARRQGSAQGRPGLALSSMLRGLTFCAGCGARMTRLNKGPTSKGGVYLACSDNQRSVGCVNGRRWRLEDVERRVVLATSSNALRSVLDQPPDAPPTERRATDIEAEIEDIRRRRGRLLDLVEEGDDDALLRARAQLERMKALAVDLKAALERERVARSEPSFAERQALLRDLLVRLDRAGGKELTDLRLRVAEELRATYARITFSSHQIALTRRNLPFPTGGPRPRWAPSPVVIFDDHPENVAWRKAELSSGELDGLASGTGRLGGLVRGTTTPQQGAS